MQSVISQQPVDGLDAMFVARSSRQCATQCAQAKLPPNNDAGDGSPDSGLAPHMHGLQVHSQGGL
jgi:hypothetical protein